jgi:hypothetical protein
MSECGRMALDGPRVYININYSLNIVIYQTHLTELLYFERVQSFVKNVLDYKLEIKCNWKICDSYNFMAVKTFFFVRVLVQIYTVSPIRPRLQV